MISLIPIIVGTIIFLKLNKFYQFTILTLVVFFPFSFGDFRSIPSLFIEEWLTFVVFLMLINELVPLNRVNKSLRLIKYNGIEIFIFALVILITWTIISYVNNEILYQSVKKIGDKIGSSRVYFGIIKNIILFFVVIMFAVTYYSEINFEKFFKILFVVSSIIGVLTVLSYFFKFEIPLLKGTFTSITAFTQGRIIEYGGLAFRFGGLAETVTIGLPSLFAYYTVKKKINMIILILFLFFVFISGGRTLMMGVMIAVTIFSVMFLPKNFIYLAIATGLLIVFSAIFLPQSVLEGQFGRLTSLNSGNFMGQDVSRGLAWKLYLDNFSKNPIWGKGISEYSSFFYSSDKIAQEFAKFQVFAGGHGSYFSLLSTFGLGGIIYFLIMIIGGIFLSYKKIKQNINLDPIKTAIAVFVFMILIIKSIEFITAGDGLKDATTIFYSVGFICSLTVLSNRKDVI